MNVSQFKSTLSTNRITYFIDVVLPLAVPNYYSYRLPFELNGQVKIGQRVVVPLGKNKRYTAIVQCIHQKVPDYPVKYIEYVLDQEPIVTQNQLLLWEWIAGYYMCHVGEVMMAALPSSLKLASETRIVKNEFYDGELPEDLTDAQVLILDAVDVAGVLSLEDIGQLLDKKVVYPIINELLHLQLIKVEEEIKKLYRPKLQKLISINPDFSNKDALQKAFELCGRAQKQQDLLLQFIQLSQQNGTFLPIEKKQLLQSTEGSIAVLGGLLKKNILIETAQRVSRFGSYQGETQKDKVLSDFQQNAYEQVKDGFAENKPVLLHGVTGSGKTEIYVKLIRDQIKKGKQVLYLLPEIALTTQLITRLKKYFGDKIGVYHSKFSPNERVEVWRSVLNEELHSYDVILGARSSVFLPFNRLGLILIDEEHEPSFKQYDPAPRYHARDVAFKLFKLHHCSVLMGSATPSIESMLNAKNQVFKYVELTKRFSNILLPEIQCADLVLATKKKQMHGIYSSLLLNEIKAVLDRNEQVILFQNRRGYAPKWICETCGWKTMCTRCDVSLTYHKYPNTMNCHYCGYSTPVPKQCGACGSSKLKMVGFGTEKIEEELQELLGNSVRIQRMDLDTTRKKNAYHEIIQSFENRQIDVLVGTQMVSKGLDFDHVALVGILNADDMLYFPDFRAFERSFQLMAQVSGRAGRKKKRGKVIVQSYNPDHWILQKLMRHDYQGMFDQELVERKQFNYPPYSRLIKLTVVHKFSDVVDAASNELAELLKQKLGSRVLGPEYPSIARIRNSYHKVITLKFEKSASVKKIKAFLLDAVVNLKHKKPYKSSRVKIDVDPV